MSDIFTLPNVLSLLRLPLALCLFINDPVIRFSVFLVAMLTDILDGFFARRRLKVSRFGTILDPLTDKLFVFTAIALFFFEGKIGFLELLSFLSRDFSLVVFTVIIYFLGGWGKFSIQSFYCGKITTAMQFLILMAVSLNLEVLPLFYMAMAAFGLLSFVELLWIYSWQKENDGNGSIPEK